MFWTLFPRQRVLERVPKIKETPRQDDVVVERHKETHLKTIQSKHGRFYVNRKIPSPTNQTEHCSRPPSVCQCFSYHTAGVANPCELGRDELPHSNTALSDGLSSSQLQEEEGNANDQHQQDVEKEKGS